MVAKPICMGFFQRTGPHPIKKPCKEQGIHKVSYLHSGTYSEQSKLVNLLCISDTCLFQTKKKEKNLHQQKRETWKGMKGCVVEGDCYREYIHPKRDEYIMFIHVLDHVSWTFNFKHTMRFFWMEKTLPPPNHHNRGKPTNGRLMRWALSPEVNKGHPGEFLKSTLTRNYKGINTLQEINIFHLGKRKIIFKMPFWGIC